MEIYLLAIVCIGVIFDGLLVQATTLQISEHVVFKPGGQLDLSCWFEDPSPPPEISFIWHHNDTRLDFVETRPNQPNYDNLVKNKLTFFKASLNDSGIYSCSIHDRPGEVVSAVVTPVLVDEAPIVAEISKSVSINILDPSQTSNNIRCFTADDQLTEIPGCVYNIQSLKRNSDIGIFESVIASSKALEHYGSVHSAVGHQVTFNTSKPLLGLKIHNAAQNVTFKLYGTDRSLNSVRVACLDKQEKQEKIISVSEIESGREDRRVFVCSRGDTEPDITVRIMTSKLVLFDRTVPVNDNTSAATPIKLSYLFILFCCSFIYLL